MDYRNVKAKPLHLQEMLGHTAGGREVPVIVEGKDVTIGYGGT